MADVRVVERKRGVNSLLDLKILVDLLPYFLGIFRIDKLAVVLLGGVEVGVASPELGEEVLVLG